MRGALAELCSRRSAAIPVSVRRRSMSFEPCHTKKLSLNDILAANTRAHEKPPWGLDTPAFSVKLRTMKIRFGGRDKGARQDRRQLGRVDDRAGDGMGLVSQILQIYENYGFETEVIVASVRHVRHVVEAALLGAHIATVPYAVAVKLFDHPLTDEGIKRFLADWEKIPR